MKIVSVYLAVFIFIFPVCIVLAEGYKDKDGRDGASDGMKKIHQGSVTISVPKGQEIIKSGSVTTMESFKQYTVKRFLDAEARVSELEEAQKRSNQEIKQLKELVVDLRKTVAELKQELHSGQEEAAEKTGGRQ